MWRTMTMRHHSVEFSLMEAGHTKFHPDWHFGLWKVRWRNSTVETLTEMAESVAASSRSNHNIPQLVDDPDCPVVFYDWASFFKKWFKPIPHITSYHHFRYDMVSFLVFFCKNWDTDYFSCMASVNIKNSNDSPSVLQKQMFRVCTSFTSLTFSQKYPIDKPRF